VAARKKRPAPASSGSPAASSGLASTSGIRRSGPATRLPASDEGYEGYDEEQEGHAKPGVVDRPPSMTHSSKAANRKHTTAIANPIGRKVFFQVFMNCAPDYESLASLIADMPPTRVVELGSFSYLLLYSDGVYEIARPGQPMWKFHEFVEFISRLPREESMGDRLLTHVRQLGCSESLADDFSVLEVRFWHLDDLMPSDCSNGMMYT
jgi:hypothetical protein